MNSTFLCLLDTLDRLPRPFITSMSRLAFPAFNLTPVPSPLPIAVVQHHRSIRLASRISARPLDVSARLPWLSTSPPWVLMPPRHMRDISLPPGSSSSIVIYMISTLLTHCSFSALPAQVVTLEPVGTTHTLHWQVCGGHRRRGNEEVGFPEIIHYWN